MALACKCDRCGKFFSAKGKASDKIMDKTLMVNRVTCFSSEPGNYSADYAIDKESWDLCVDCYKDFISFMKMVALAKED